MFLLLSMLLLICTTQFLGMCILINFVITQYTKIKVEEYFVIFVTAAGLENSNQNSNLWYDRMILEYSEYDKPTKSKNGSGEPCTKVIMNTWAKCRERWKKVRQCTLTNKWYLLSNGAKKKVKTNKKIIILF